MKIILADTHGPVLGKDQGTPNLSILYLAAYLRAHVPGIEVHYVPQKYDLAHHARLIEAIEPDFYGASFTSYGAPVTYALINDLKRRFPELRVLCGGAHASAAPRDVLERSRTDVCVIGEGEQTLLELVRLKRFPEGLADVRGIAYRTREGRLRFTPPRALFDDIDAVPFPSRDLVDDRDYAGLSHRKARPNAEMIITRGCPYRCVFCANPVFRGDGPKYRARSPESIAAEADELYRRGYREIYLHSDELNVRLDWSIDVCKALAGLGHRDLFFQTNLRVTPMSEEFAYWLKAANFWMVRFGIESASQRVLVGIKKKMSRFQTEQACRLVAAQGIKVYGYFMMFQYWEDDGAIQFETADEVLESIRFARRLWLRGHLHYTSWMYALPVHGAEFHDVALRHGMIDESFYPNFDWNPADHMPVTHETFSRLFKKARRLQALMALRAGGFELRNWRALWHKAKTMIWGHRRTPAIEAEASDRASERAA